MPNRITLEQISISSPCHEGWENMTGDARKRFCQICQKHVHDLSTMTRSEAEKMLCRTGGELCLRLAYDVDSKIITADSTASLKQSFFRRWLPAAGKGSFLASLLLLIGCRDSSDPAGGIRWRTTGVACVQKPDSDSSPAASQRETQTDER